MSVEKPEFTVRMSRGLATIACLAGLLLTGCDRQAPSGSVAEPGAAEGVGDMPGAPGAGDGGQAPGAPGPGGDGGQGAPGPGGDGGQGAPGSPMRMPIRVQGPGSALDDALDFFEKELTAECGGSLCVDIDVAYTEPTYSRCEYYSSDPAPGTVFRYRRNMTVTIIAGSQECEPTPGEEGSTDPPTDPPTDPGSPGDGSTDGQTGESTDGQTGDAPAGDGSS